MKYSTTKKTVDNTETYRVQSIERAISILNCFSFQHKERSLAEIVSMTGLNRSTARRFVRSMETHGLLQEDPDGKSFHLGMRLFELGGIAASSFSLNKAMAQPLAQLEENMEGAIVVGLKVDDYFVYVDKREKNDLVSLPAEIGMKRPLTFGTIGRILMAHMQQDEIRTILRHHPLKSYTPHSITDEKALYLELERIKKNEFGIDVEEFTEGVMGIAAPIIDSSRRALAALCIGIPASRSRDKSYVEQATSKVISAADQISYNLGYIAA